MTSRTPRRHRRLALMAAGTAAAMVLLPGAASAQVVPTVQQFAGAPGDPAVPGVPNDRNAPAAPAQPDLDEVPQVPGLNLPGEPGRGAPGLNGDHDRDRDRDRDRDDDVVHRDDTEDSDHLDDPEPPDHASGAVADIDLLREDLLEITKYDATIEDDDEAHADSTVLGLGGDGIVGRSASSRDGDGRDGDNLTTGLCDGTGGVICLSLLYHDAVAEEDDDSSLAAARGGVLALCLGGGDDDGDDNGDDNGDDVTATYECDGALSLGVAEGLGIAERDKKDGHTRAESANELLNLCIGKRESLTESCDGLGLQAVHSDSDSESKTPDTHRGSYLLGIDSDGESSYLLDDPEAIGILDCGDSAILCLFLNQGKSVIYRNPQGAGSVQEMLRLDVLDRTLLVVLGQAETLAHEADDRDRDRDRDRPECSDGEDNDHDGKTDHKEDPDCESADDDSEAGDKGEGDGGGDKGDGGGLADTGADIVPLLAGGFLLTGMGALTVAGTRRRAGKHTL
ncbi:MAG TPA: hypothetical protein VNA67_04295 [Pseudonocardiaceae bacterium]|nr:hypothetical protein [Pseudonocardiaceae bacterium]